MDVTTLITGFSKALYSNWLLYRPDNLLIDCGEGCATALGNGVYAVERILLTHGHIDHIGGLPSFIWARASAMGDTEKPLTVYHPRDDRFLADMRDYLDRAAGRLPFRLSWIPLDAGDRVELVTEGRHPRGFTTFPTEHIPGRLTIGYKIVEQRRRLKQEFASLSQNEIRDRVQNGAVNGRDLMEDYEAIITAFGGDGLALNPDFVSNAELLVHEATILDAADRKHQLHSTVGEAIACASAARANAVIINHLSGRYTHSEVHRAIRTAASEANFTGELWCLLRHRLQKIEMGETH